MLYGIYIFVIFTIESIIFLFHNLNNNIQYFYPFSSNILKMKNFFLKYVNISQSIDSILAFFSDAKKRDREI